MTEMKNDYIQSDSLIEWRQTGSVNDNCKYDKSNCKVAEVIQNQNNSSDNEIIDSVTESLRYELADTQATDKYMKHIIEVTKNFVDKDPAKPKDYEEWTDEKRYKYLLANVQKYIPNFPKSLLFLLQGMKYRGDCGPKSMEKPFWLDMEKFRRGQKFAQDYMVPIFFANLLSLFGIFAFEHSLKPLILSKKSHTPYLAFKR